MAVSAQLQCHASSQRTSVHNSRHPSPESLPSVIYHVTLCWEHKSLKLKFDAFFFFLSHQKI